MALFEPSSASAISTAHNLTLIFPHRLEFQSVFLTNRIGHLRSEAEKAKKQTLDTGRRLQQIIKLQHEKEKTYDQVRSHFFTFRKRIQLLIRRDRYETTKRDSVVRVREERKKGFETYREKLLSRRRTIVCNNKLDRTMVCQTLRKAEDEIAVSKRTAARRVRLSESLVGDVKERTERRKVRRVTRMKERKKRLELEMREKEEKKVERLEEVETGLAEKVRNTQAGHEMLMLKLRAALTKRPVNYEEYRKKLEEHREKMRSCYRNPRLRPICSTTAESADCSETPNNCSC